MFDGRESLREEGNVDDATGLIGALEMRQNGIHGQWLARVYLGASSREQIWKWRRILRDWQWDDFDVIVGKSRDPIGCYYWISYSGQMRFMPSSIFPVFCVNRPTRARAGMRAHDRTSPFTTRDNRVS